MLSKDIEMEIVVGKPPIYEEAHKHFEIDDRVTFYTWGNKIYNPSGRYVPDHIIEHESVHMRQQEKIGGPEIWWRNYIADKAFRLKQEVEAYGRQYWFIRDNEGDRNKHAKFMHELASDLSSPLYKVDIDYQDARRAILEEAKKYD